MHNGGFKLKFKISDFSICENMPLYGQTLINAFLTTILTYTPIFSNFQREHRIQIDIVLAIGREI